jgi:Xaa-Pro dipeptidase
MADTVHAARVAAMQARMRMKRLSAWILVPGPNMRYFTGWDAHASERVLMAVYPTEGDPFLVTPAFEAERAREATGIARAYTWRDESGPAAAVARAFAPWGKVRPRFGGEFLAMRLMERAAVDAVCPRAEWEDIGPDAAALRMVKDAEEIAAMERAVAIAETALEAGRRQIAAGRSERDIQRAVQRSLLEQDSASGFGVLVASGPRSALPHARSSDRVLEPGDLVWIDMGAIYAGYQADITRTFCVGRPPDALRAAYRTVLQAQEAARTGAGPGRTCESVDRLARQVISGAGLGEYFTHRTGHGLGLEEHEAPFIVDGNAEVLQPGMVYTVEPGVYVPGQGGIRIEDDVVVTADGVRSLTGFRRDWLEE